MRHFLLLLDTEDTCPAHAEITTTRVAADLTPSEAVLNDHFRDLTADAIIQASGWHPTYARVLLIEHDEQDAVVLVDGNGDGAELELEYWHRGEDGLWHGGASSGHGALVDLQIFQAWNAGEFVAAVGRARPKTEVSVQYGGQVHRRRANEFGTWAFVHTADSMDSGELPAAVMESPPPG